MIPRASLKNNHNQHHTLIQYIILLSILTIIYVGYLVVAPFVNALLTAMIISYIFYPLYQWIKKYLHSEKLAAIIVSVSLLLLVAIPFILILDNLAPEARYVYIRAKQHIVTGELIDINCAGKATTICRFSNFIKDVVQDPSVKFPLEDMLAKLTTLAIEKTSSVLLSLPGIILSVVVTFFITFYLFIDGPKLVKKCKNLIPLKRIHKEHMFKKFQDTTYAVIYGSIIIAIIQGKDSLQYAGRIQKYRRGSFSCY